MIINITDLIRETTSYFVSLFRRFECCLATYKFKDPHPAPKKPAKVHHVKPVASPQRVPVPKLLSPPEPEPEREPEPEPEPAQDTQQTPYAASYQNPNPAAAMAPLTGKIVCSY